MKIELLTIAAISGLCAFSQAATILTDFSTTTAHAGGNGTINAVGATVQVSGDNALVTYGGTFTAATNDLRYMGNNGAGALGETVSLNKNNEGAIAGSFSVNYAIGASDVQISTITMKSGFFNGGSGAFQGDSAAATYTLIFTSAEGTELARWTGTQSYSANATQTSETILTGDAFVVDSNSTLNLAIQIAKPATGSTVSKGFIGIDSISMEANAIPEPATASLGLLGLGALMLRRRRK